MYCRREHKWLVAYEYIIYTTVPAYVHILNTLQASVSSTCLLSVGATARLPCSTCAAARPPQDHSMPKPSAWHAIIFLFFLFSFLFSCCFRRFVSCSRAALHSRRVQLCLPNGLQFCTQRGPPPESPGRPSRSAESSPLSRLVPLADSSSSSSSSGGAGSGSGSADWWRRPRLYSVVLTREDNTRLYGVALVFYERVADARVRDAMAALQSDYDTQFGPASPAPQGCAFSILFSTRSCTHAVQYAFKHCTSRLVASRCVGHQFSDCSFLCVIRPAISIRSILGMYSRRRRRGRGGLNRLSAGGQCTSSEISVFFSSVCIFVARISCHCCWARAHLACLCLLHIL